MTIGSFGRKALSLRPIINVSGTMTALGASIMRPEAILAMTAIADEFVEIDDLHSVASDTISNATGADAGFVTASAAAGIIIAVAAVMTGKDRPAIERLPLDTKNLKTEVVFQRGHDVNYGNSISQAVCMAGATPVLCGSVTSVSAGQLADKMTANTAAGLFVVSHTTSRTGMLDLSEFVALCHARKVPVIVDAASEYDLKGFLADGADLVIYSGHKFLGGPTTGIIAGRRDLVEACRLQNSGIGRAMKVGKESIAGLIAALEAWQVRDHEAVRREERRALDLWEQCLAGFDGIEVEIVPDPTRNPLDRLEIRVRSHSKTSAAEFAFALSIGDPPVIVRSHKVDQGVFWLDPCNLHNGEAEQVASSVQKYLKYRYEI